jgi:hypothetical protein
MTKEQHPITPSQELMKQWWHKATVEEALIRAAQWGADQELEACVDFVYDKYENFANKMQAARRPKPLSVKEQALEALDYAMELTLNENLYVKIRRALEQLDD